MFGLVAKPKKDLEELKSALSGDMSREERAYLEKLESSLKGQVDYDDPEQVEAEVRRREKERIAKNFKPRAPLYKQGQGGETQQLKPKSDDKQSYQNDPRYREYYDRLKKSRTESQADVDEQPMTMDDLEQK